MRESNKKSQLANNKYPWLINIVFYKLHRDWHIPFKYGIIDFLKLIFGDKRIVTKEKNASVTFAVDPRDLIQRSLLYEQEYEPELTAILLRMLSPDDVVYDIGANIGYYSMLSLSVGSRVFAFDPDPINVGLIKYHLELNGFNSCKLNVFECAIGSSNSEAIFYRANIANTGVSSMLKINGSYAKEFSVEIFTLDHLIKEHSLIVPTILKIDVEGWEYEVFKGAEKLLNSEEAPRLIFFEANSNSEGEIQDHKLMDFLSKANYQIKWLPRKSGLVEEKENYVAVHDRIPKNI